MASPMSNPKVRRALMFSVPLALVLGAGYVWLSGGRYEETDNAALHQVRINIASSLPGRIVSVSVTDNGRVKSGDPMFQIDQQPYTLALAQADAALAQARLGVQQLKAAYGVAVAQERVAADQADYLKSEFRRAQSLTGKGVSTDSSLDKARYASTQADEALATAHEGVKSALAALGGDAAVEVDAHPAVLAALAARDTAIYNLTLTTLNAPADGLVYQAASFRPGQFVAAGAPLFALVETTDLWVDANFKETQLDGIHPGQPADVVFDTRPGVHYAGKVEAIGAGTGSEFSIIPAQNATGNWVKVTQRVPVRIRLTDAAAAADLQSGVSATVTVDTGRQSALAGLAAEARELRSGK